MKTIIVFYTAFMEAFVFTKKVPLRRKREMKKSFAKTS